MEAQNLGPTNSITRKLALKLFKLCKGDDYERTLRSVAYDIMYTARGGAHRELHRTSLR